MEARTNRFPKCRCLFFGVLVNAFGFRVCHVFRMQIPYDLGSVCNLGACVGLGTEAHSDCGPFSAWLREDVTEPLSGLRV